VTSVDTGSDADGDTAAAAVAAKLVTFCSAVSPLTGSRGDTATATTHTVSKQQQLDKQCIN